MQLANGFKLIVFLPKKLSKNEVFEQRKTLKLKRPHYLPILTCTKSNLPSITCLFSCTTGSSQIKLENAYGTQLDLSWFTVVSTVISIAAILSGATWTLEPIEKQTYS